MKYNVLINQYKSVEWGLTTSEAFVFSWIYELASWAEKLIYNSETYYFCSRNEACRELPLVTDKPDTMYRIYKSLEKKGLISMVTLNKKDYASLTQKGKEWYDNYEDPKLGKISEETRKNFRENSEKNPTNNNTNNNNTNNNIKKDTNVSKEIQDLSWKDNYSEYVKMVYQAKERVLNDSEFKSMFNTYHPNHDFEMTISKSVDMYWKTEETWNKQRRKNTKSINLYSAIKKGYDLNLVYKSKYNNQGVQRSKNEKEENNEVVILRDGTFMRGGYRYYRSKNHETYSIPPNAPDRPSEEYEYSMTNKNWYK